MIKTQTLVHYTEEPIPGDIDGQTPIFALSRPAPSVFANPTCHPYLFADLGPTVGAYVATNANLYTLFNSIASRKRCGEFIECFHHAGQTR